MKFTNLKEAMSAIGEFICRPKPPPLPPPFFGTKERRQTVVGGRISRDPINQQAAKILRKAGWLEKLLPEADKTYYTNERQERTENPVVQTVLPPKRKKTKRQNSIQPRSGLGQQRSLRTPAEHDAKQAVVPMETEGEAAAPGTPNSKGEYLDRQEAQWRLLQS